MVPEKVIWRDTNMSAPREGKIIEEHDNIPGFRDHDIWISCDECSKKYTLDTSRGVRGWELVEKE